MGIGLTRVIVVDDDEDIVFVMSELLEAHGMQVVGKGYNGLEGVELFEKLEPDLTLLDLKMPRYDGLYALRKIRERDPIANVIIVSGNVPKNIEDELHSLNPTKILLKPIDIGFLVESFAVESSIDMSFKIKYKFKNDKKFYTCTLTYEQFKNFRKLPIVKECEVIKKDEKNVEDYKKDMQNALDLAVKNDTSHIRKLSQIMP